MTNDNKPSSTNKLKQIIDAITNYLNTCSQSFQLDTRETNIHKKLMQIAKLQQQLEEQQAFLDVAHTKTPIFLSTKDRLIILESFLVARTRENQPVDDLIKAIEAVRNNIVVIDETKPPMVDIKPVQNQSNETIISHKYKIPILSEIGYAINSITTFTTATLVLSWLGIFIISITNPILCRRRKYFYGTYENKSLFCQTSKNINRLFEDLQKVKGKDK
ncbi:MAG: hypothetical protein KME64_42930 [Scytonematopsis contorta HA4267-MV1]|jgi:hypothetical protein|nr:hypothetical protein [Scytonematopsis contorta HA4267-MV1]